jgi:hypothetical protein
VWSPVREGPPWPREEGEGPLASAPAPSASLSKRLPPEVGLAGGGGDVHEAPPDARACAHACVRWRASGPRPSPPRPTPPPSPEQELAVEVGDVDGVHIDHIDVHKPRQREVFQDLAAQAARADAQHAAVLRLDELAQLGARLKPRAHQVALAGGGGGCRGGVGVGGGEDPMQCARAS